MPPEERPRDTTTKEPRASLGLRLDRAAGELNPFMILVAVGLTLLNLTVFVGLTISREPFMHLPAGHQSDAAATGPGQGTPSGPR